MEVILAHTDIIVLGAGIVGTAIALHLVKRGLSVALVDRGGPGEGTSYGNAGIIEGNTIFPRGLSVDWAELLRIALKRSPVANYHLTFLPQVAPWLLAFHAASQPARLVETAQADAAAVGARGRRARSARAPKPAPRTICCHQGWLKLYRTDRSFAGVARERDLAARIRHRQSAARPRCARWRSNRRWRRCSAMPCIGRAR